jgi:hypothetical protein
VRPLHEPSAPGRPRTLGARRYTGRLLGSNRSERPAHTSLGLFDDRHQPVALFKQTSPHNGPRRGEVIEYLADDGGKEYNLELFGVSRQQTMT